jgi:tetratricopeptide (TPR) repeat protein
MKKTSSFKAQYQNAIELKKVGRPDEAARMLTDLVAVYPDIALLHWELGYAQLDSGLAEKSIKSFTDAISLEPKCLPAWGGLGHAYSELSEWDLAETSFRKRLALKESPNHYLFLCEVLSAKGDYLGALRCCDRAVALRPDGESYLNLGLTYRDLRLWDQASEALEKAIELDPDDPRAMAELGFLKFRTEEFDVAEVLLRRALVNDECPSCVHAYLGLTLEAKAQYNECEREFKAAVDADPDDDFSAREYRRFRRRKKKREKPQ